MRKDFLCLVLMLFIFLHVSAQLNDSFTDGNFTSNPAWHGNTSNWQIVTNSDVAAGAANSNTLRLNVASGAGVAYLSNSIPGNWGLAQSWSFFVGRRAQAYTAANHTIIWLWASDENLLLPSINGYCIRIGDDSGGDDIVLQRVTNGIATDIVASAATLVNGLTDIGFQLRITHTSEGQWKLFTSTLPAANGTGAVATDVIAANILQATATDNTYTIFDDGFIGFVNAYGSGTAARAAQEFDQVQLSFTPVAMPVKLRDFAVSASGPGAKLIWDVFEESNVLSYEIQCSQNGLGFIPIGSIKAEHRNTYTFIDARNTGQDLFYRLKVIDVDGSFTYSHIINLRGKTELKITGRGRITISHSPTSGTLSVISMDGRVLQKFLVPPNAAETVVELSNLPAGCYNIVLVTPYRSLSRLFTNLSSL
ncbi:MAG TPA: hypothetical protein VEB42_11065 [Chitinophagaceae bacterium]|nr:hypothetical protein [Chitinophagaceae bacterium]